MVEVLRETLINYFNILKQAGFRCYNKVDMLIILCFLEELTERKFHIFLNYSDIHEVLNLINLMMDSLCEFYDEKEIDFKTFLEGHHWWHNPDDWISPQIYIGDKTICERCEELGAL